MLTDLQAPASHEDGLEQQLPEFLPIVTGTNGMASEVGASGAGPSEPIPLLSLMANVLLSYTLGFERDAPLSLPIAENVVRVLDGTTSIDVRELPRAAAVSPEATTMALTYLRKKGYVEGTKGVRLTPAGISARDAAQSTHAGVESAWKRRLSETRVERLREALRAILDQRDGERRRVALGLEPYADGWRTEARYAERTRAMLADPVAGLPRHPMILHRGGWPDGS